VLSTIHRIKPKGNGSHYELDIGPDKSQDLFGLSEKIVQNKCPFARFHNRLDRTGHAVIAGTSRERVTKA
jgi:hypothetical protein